MTEAELDALLADLEADLQVYVQEQLDAVSAEFADAVDGATELVAAAFSVSRIRDMWRRRVPPIMTRLRGIARQSAAVTAEDLNLDPPAPAEVNRILDPYIAATTPLVEAVGDHLAQAAVAQLNEGLAAGEDLDQLKARMLTVFDDAGAQLGPVRAQRIAATEANRAWNAGAAAAADALTGPERPLVKQWRTRGDDRVRKAHRDADGQLRLLDETFTVDGAQMRYPGDPLAPADLTIACRCMMRVSHAPADERTASMEDGSIQFDRMPPQLREYWIHGEGAAKIRWGTPGSFERCVRALRPKFPQDPEGLCANLHHEATGKWPSQKAATEHTGAMIALIPSEADAERLAFEGGESAGQLHLTLMFLGEAADWSEIDQSIVRSRVGQLAGSFPPVHGHAFGAAQWNPDGDNPCWVWNIGNSRDPEMGGSRLEDVHQAVTFDIGDMPQIPQQHSPWAPHVAGIYTPDNMHNTMAAQVGPVTFDRIRVAFAGEYIDYPLMPDDGEGREHMDEDWDDESYGFEVGDRVTVTGGPHESGQVSGTVSQVVPGPAYGITFDGTDTVHHWYVGAELAPEDGGQAVAPDVAPSYAVAAWSTPGDSALAFENQQTGDGRVFAPGALRWDGSGPWPLQYADEMLTGHEGARLAGAIETMERDGDRLTGTGVLYLNKDAGWEAASLLAQDAPLGVSVDLDDVDLEAVDATTDTAYRSRLLTASMLPLPDGGWWVTGETAPEIAASEGGVFVASVRLSFGVAADGSFDALSLVAAAGDPDVADGAVLDRQESGQYLMRITRARVRGATLVSVPAFAGARIELDNPGLFASSATEELDASAANTTYERVVRYVRKSITPVTAAEAARFLKIPVVVARRHLAAAVKKEELVRLSRGSYTKPTERSQVASGVTSLTASATGQVDLPVAPRDAEWDGDAAAGRIFDMATGADGSVDTSVLDDAFAYRDDDAPPAEKRSRKLPFADVIGGRLTIVPKGVSSALGALSGARGTGVDIPQDQVDAVRSKLTAIQAHVDEELGGEGMADMEASAWTAMRDLPPMPAAWFREPTAEELPPGGPGVNYSNGRIFGWVAQAGEPHAGFAKKITIDGLGRIDTAHFLRQRFTLDDGSVVKAGAFTMNVGHHRDGAECETSACQFDDSRTVAGIVTVGMNARGMWFSGAAAPWLSEWDRSVFMSVQPSYHLKKGPQGNWQLRAVLSVPVPGHSSPLLASAVVERSQMALTAAATMAEVEEVVRSEQRAQLAAQQSEPIDYDKLADSLVAAMARAEQRKAEEAAELEALLSEARSMEIDTTTDKGA